MSNDSDGDKNLGSSAASTSAPNPETQNQPQGLRRETSALFRTDNIPAPGSEDYPSPLLGPQEDVDLSQEEFPSPVQGPQVGRFGTYVTADNLSDISFDLDPVSNKPTNTRESFSFVPSNSEEKWVSDLAESEETRALSEWVKSLSAYDSYDEDAKEQLADAWIVMQLRGDKVQSMVVGALKDMAMKLFNMQYETEEAAIEGIKAEITPSFELLIKKVDEEKKLLLAEARTRDQSLTDDDEDLLASLLKEKLKERRLVSIQSKLARFQRDRELLREAMHDDLQAFNWVDDKLRDSLLKQIVPYRVQQLIEARREETRARLTAHEREALKDTNTFDLWLENKPIQEGIKARQNEIRTRLTAEERSALEDKSTFELWSENRSIQKRMEEPSKPSNDAKSDKELYEQEQSEQGEEDLRNNLLAKLTVYRVNRQLGAESPEIPSSEVKSDEDLYEQERLVQGEGKLRNNLLSKVITHRVNQQLSQQADADASLNPENVRTEVESAVGKINQLDLWLENRALQKSKNPIGWQKREASTYLESYHEARLGQDDDAFRKDLLQKVVTNRVNQQIAIDEDTDSATATQEVVSALQTVSTFHLWLENKWAEDQKIAIEDKRRQALGDKYDEDVGSDIHQDKVDRSAAVERVFSNPRDILKAKWRLGKVAQQKGEDDDGTSLMRDLLKQGSKKADVESILEERDEELKPSLTKVRLLSDIWDLAQAEEKSIKSQLLALESALAYEPKTDPFPPYPKRDSRTADDLIQALRKTIDDTRAANLKKSTTGSEAPTDAKGTTQATDKSGDTILADAETVLTALETQLSDVQAVKEGAYAGELSDNEQINYSRENDRRKQERDDLGDQIGDQIKDISNLKEENHAAKITGNVIHPGNSGKHGSALCFSNVDEASGAIAILGVRNDGLLSGMHTGSSNNGSLNFDKSPFAKGYSTWQEIYVAGAIDQFNRNSPDGLKKRRDIIDQLSRLVGPGVPIKFYNFSDEGPINIFAETNSENKLEFFWNHADSHSITGKTYTVSSWDDVKPETKYTEQKVDWKEDPRRKPLPTSAFQKYSLYQLWNRSWNTFKGVTRIGRDTTAKAPITEKSLRDEKSANPADLILGDIYTKALNRFTTVLNDPQPLIDALTALVNSNGNVSIEEINPLRDLITQLKEIAWIYETAKGRQLQVAKTMTPAQKLEWEERVDIIGQFSKAALDLLNTRLMTGEEFPHSTFNDFGTAGYLNPRVRYAEGFANQKTEIIATFQTIIPKLQELQAAMIAAQNEHTRPPEDLKNERITTALGKRPEELSADELDFYENLHQTRQKVLEGIVGFSVTATQLGDVGKNRIITLANQWAGAEKLSGTDGELRAMATAVDFFCDLEKAPVWEKLPQQIKDLAPRAKALQSTIIEKFPLQQFRNPLIISAQASIERWKEILNDADADADALNNALHGLGDTKNATLSDGLTQIFRLAALQSAHSTADGESIDMSQEALDRNGDQNRDAFIHNADTIMGSDEGVDEFKRQLREVMDGLTLDKREVLKDLEGVQGILRTFVNTMNAVLSKTRVPSKSQSVSLTKEPLEPTYEVPDLLRHRQSPGANTCLWQSFLNALTPQQEAAIAATGIDLSEDGWHQFLRQDTTDTLHFLRIFTRNNDITPDDIKDALEDEDFCDENGPDVVADIRRLEKWMARNNVQSFNESDHLDDYLISVQAASEFNKLRQWIDKNKVALEEAIPNIQQLFSQPTFISPSSEPYAAYLLDEPLANDAALMVLSNDPDDYTYKKNAKDFGVGHFFTLKYQQSDIPGVGLHKRIDPLYGESVVTPSKAFRGKTVGVFLFNAPNSALAEYMQLDNEPVKRMANTLMAITGIPIPPTDLLDIPGIGDFNELQGEKIVQAIDEIKSLAPDNSPLKSVNTSLTDEIYNIDNGSLAINSDELRKLEQALVRGPGEKNILTSLPIPPYSVAVAWDARSRQWMVHGDEGPKELRAFFAGLMKDQRRYDLEAPRPLAALQLVRVSGLQQRISRTEVVTQTTEAIKDRLQYQLPGTFAPTIAARALRQPVQVISTYVPDVPEKQPSGQRKPRLSSAEMPGDPTVPQDFVVGLNNADILTIAGRVVMPPPDGDFHIPSNSIIHVASDDSVLVRYQNPGNNAETLMRISRERLEEHQKTHGKTVSSIKYDLANGQQIGGFDIPAKSAITGKLGKDDQQIISEYVYEKHFRPAVDALLKSRNITPPENYRPALRDVQTTPIPKNESFDIKGIPLRITSNNTVIFESSKPPVRYRLPLSEILGKAANKDSSPFVYKPATGKVSKLFTKTKDWINKANPWRDAVLTAPVLYEVPLVRLQQAGIDQDTLNKNIKYKDAMHVHLYPEQEQLKTSEYVQLHAALYEEMLQKTEGLLPSDPLRVSGALSDVDQLVIHQRFPGEDVKPVEASSIGVDIGDAIPFHITARGTVLYEQSEKMRKEGSPALIEVPIARILALIPEITWESLQDGVRLRTPMPPRFTIPPLPTSKEITELITDDSEINGELFQDKVANASGMLTEDQLHISGALSSKDLLALSEKAKGRDIQLIKAPTDQSLEGKLVPLHITERHSVFYTTQDFLRNGDKLQALEVPLARALIMNLPESPLNSQILDLQRRIQAGIEVNLNAPALGSPEINEKLAALTNRREEEQQEKVEQSANTKPQISEALQREMKDAIDAIAKDDPAIRDLVKKMKDPFATFNAVVTASQTPPAPQARRNVFRKARGYISRGWFESSSQSIVRYQAGEGTKINKARENINGLMTIAGNYLYFKPEQVSATPVDRPALDDTQLRRMKFRGNSNGKRDAYFFPGATQNLDITRVSAVMNVNDDGNGPRDIILRKQTLDALVTHAAAIQQVVNHPDYGRPTTDNSHPDTEAKEKETKRDSIDTDRESKDSEKLDKSGPKVWNIPVYGKESEFDQLAALRNIEDDEEGLYTKDLVKRTFLGEYAQTRDSHTLPASDTPIVTNDAGITTDNIRHADDQTLDSHFPQDADSIGFDGPNRKHVSTNREGNKMSPDLFVDVMSTHLSDVERVNRSNSPDSTNSLGTLSRSWRKYLVRHRGSVKTAVICMQSSDPLQAPLYVSLTRQKNGRYYLLDASNRTNAEGNNGWAHGQSPEPGKPAGSVFPLRGSTPESQLLDLPDALNRAYKGVVTPATVEIFASQQTPSRDALAQQQERFPHISPDLDAERAQEQFRGSVASRVLADENEPDVLTESFNNADDALVRAGANRTYRQELLTEYLDHYRTAEQKDKLSPEAFLKGLFIGHLKDTIRSVETLITQYGQSLLAQARDSGAPSDRDINADIKQAQNSVKAAKAAIKDRTDGSIAGIIDAGSMLEDKGKPLAKHAVGYMTEALFDLQVKCRDEDVEQLREINANLLESDQEFQRGDLAFTGHVDNIVKASKDATVIKDNLLINEIGTVIIGLDENTRTLLPAITSGTQRFEPVSSQSYELLGRAIEGLKTIPLTKQTPEEADLLIQYEALTQKQKRPAPEVLRHCVETLKAFITSDSPTVSHFLLSMTPPPFDDLLHPAPQEMKILNGWIEAVRIIEGDKSTQLEKDLAPLKNIGNTSNTASDDNSNTVAGVLRQEREASSDVYIMQKVVLNIAKRTEIKVPKVAKAFLKKMAGALPTPNAKDLEGTGVDAPTTTTSRIQQAGNKLRALNKKDENPETTRSDTDSDTKSDTKSVDVPANKLPVYEMPQDVKDTVEKIKELSTDGKKRLGQALESDGVYRTSTPRKKNPMELLRRAMTIIEAHPAEAPIEARDILQASRQMDALPIMGIVSYMQNPNTAIEKQRSERQRIQGAETQLRTAYDGLATPNAINPACATALRQFLNSGSPKLERFLLAMAPPPHDKINDPLPLGGKILLGWQKAVKIVESVDQVRADALKDIFKIGEDETHPKLFVSAVKRRLNNIHTSTGITIPPKVNKYITALEKMDDLQKSKPEQESRTVEVTPLTSLPTKYQTASAQATLLGEKIRQRDKSVQMQVSYAKLRTTVSLTPEEIEAINRYEKKNGPPTQPREFKDLDQAFRVPGESILCVTLKDPMLPNQGSVPERLLIVIADKNGDTNYAFVSKDRIQAKKVDEKLRGVQQDLLKLKTPSAIQVSAVPSQQKGVGLGRK